MQYLQEIKHYTKGIQIKDINSITHYGKVIAISGLVFFIQKKINKQGNKIIICTLNDQYGYIDVILFTEVYKKYHHLIKENSILIVYGMIRTRDFNERFRMVAHEIMDISEAREKYASSISIFLSNKQINDKFLNYIHIFFKSYLSGKLPIHFYCQQGKIKTKLNFGLNLNIKPTNDLLNNLQKLFGNTQVVINFN